MKRTRARGIAVLTLLVALVAHPATAEEMTVVPYVDLTIARLELIEESWQQDRLGPSRGEIEALAALYGTTNEQYLTYYARYRQEVDAYLAAQPELSAEIERLSTGINALVRRAE